MKKKRILFLSSIFPPEIGGPASYSEEIIKILSKKMEVYLISSYSDKKVNLNTYDFLHFQFKGTMIDRAFLFFVKTLELMRVSDVVFSMTSPQDTFLALIIAKIFRKDSFLRVGGRYHLEFQNPLKRKFVFLLMKILNHTGVKFISVSPSITKYLKNMRIKPIIQLQNPFFDIAQKKNIKTLEGNKKIRLLTVSRLTEIKNISRILKIIKRTNNVELTVAGSGPLENSLKDEVKSLNLEDRVLFTGYIDGKKLDDLYNDSHFYITASDFEGSPNSIIKALGHNLPVIAPSTLTKTKVIDSSNSYIFDDIHEVSELLKNMAMDKYKELKIRTQLKKENRLSSHVETLLKTISI